MLFRWLNDCRSLLIAFILLRTIFAKLESVSEKYVTEKDRLNTAKDVVKGDLNLDDPMNRAKIYKELLKVKRREQLSAVKTLLSIDDSQSRKKLLKRMLENIEKMMVNSMYHITLAKYKAGDPFPSKTDELREAVALVIENVAFLGELALRFPDFVKKQLSKNKEWGEAVNWAYKFALDSGYYDDITEHMMHLAGQQLDLIPREEDFVNPYDRQHVKEELERKEAERRAELQEKKRQEKKMEAMKRKKRGPTMSKTEL